MKAQAEDRQELTRARKTKNGRRAPDPDRRTRNFWRGDGRRGDPHLLPHLRQPWTRRLRLPRWAPSTAVWAGLQHRAREATLLRAPARRGNRLAPATTISAV